MLLANLVAAASAILMAGFAAWAIRATSRDARWPMQWSVSGDVNWRASRTVALLMSVGTAGGVLALVAWSANATHRPGMLMAVSLVSAAVVCGYLIAAVRDLRAPHDGSRRI